MSSTKLSGIPYESPLMLDLKDYNEILVEDAGIGAASALPTRWIISPLLYLVRDNPPLNVDMVEAPGLEPRRQWVDSRPCPKSGVPISTQNFCGICLTGLKPANTLQRVFKPGANSLGSARAGDANHLPLLPFNKRDFFGVKWR